MFLGEIVCQVVQDDFVKVVAAQVSVAVGSQNFKYAVAQFKDGYIECTSAQVVYQDLVGAFLLVKAVGQ